MQKGKRIRFIFLQIALTHSFEKVLLKWQSMQLKRNFNALCDQNFHSILVCLMNKVDVKKEIDFFMV